MDIGLPPRADLLIFCSVGELLSFLPWHTLFHGPLPPGVFSQQSYTLTSSSLQKQVDYNHIISNAWTGEWLVPNFQKPSVLSAITSWGSLLCVSTNFSDSFSLKSYPQWIFLQRFSSYLPWFLVSSSILFLVGYLLMTLTLMKQFKTNWVHSNPIFHEKGPALHPFIHSGHIYWT